MDLSCSAVFGLKVKSGPISFAVIISSATSVSRKGVSRLLLFKALANVATPFSPFSYYSAALASHQPRIANPRDARQRWRGSTPCASVGLQPPGKPDRRRLPRSPSPVPRAIHGHRAGPLTALIAPAELGAGHRSVVHHSIKDALGNGIGKLRFVLVEKLGLIKTLNSGAALGLRIAAIALNCSGKAAELMPEMANAPAGASGTMQGLRLSSLP